LFIDQAKIMLIAGNGGNGIVSFRREKFVPKGGPNGGDGGKGGDIIIKTDRNLHTLLDFRYKRRFKAKSGGHGQGSNKTGKDGKELIIRVPPGTLIRDAETGEIIADLVAENQSVVVAKGGRGGRGNARFATPTNQTPRYAEPGQSGEVREVVLELKLIADVGLVGLPNAGKSTLLSRVSAAHPRIADYPFTTLAPNLGIVNYKDHLSFVMADIPGLIEGAHQGKGLGHNFLRHIERTRVLAFLIEAISDDVAGVFETLKNELRLYNPALLARPAVVVLTKIDLVAKEDEPDHLEPLKSAGIPILKISALTGAGIDHLKQELWHLIRKADAEPDE